MCLPVSHNKHFHSNTSVSILNHLASSALWVYVCLQLHWSLAEDILGRSIFDCLLSQDFFLQDINSFRETYRQRK